MNYFRELGAEMFRDWLRVDCDTQFLHEIAAAHLTRRPPVDHVTTDDIVTWAISTQHLPPQFDLDAQFGQPPLTVYWHPRFRIEVLFWFTATTGVHQHGFSGAFSVLQGSSVQSQYRFNRRVRVSEQLLLGDMAVEDVKVLGAGDVEPIQSGPALIHAVVHLDTPSVTVLVRTHRDESAHPQYEYYWPYVAVDPCYQDPNSTRRVQLLDVLHRITSPHYMQAAKAALESSELLGVFQILSAAKSHLRDTPAAFEELTSVAVGFHGARVWAIRAVVDERVRTESIHSRRATITDRDHRLLLALLANLRDKAITLDVIKKWYGVDDPCELLMRGVVQLSGTLTLGIEFDQLNTTIFERLLRGATIRDVLSSVQAEHQRKELLRRCQRLKSCEVFRHLLGSGSVQLLAGLLDDVASGRELSVSQPAQAEPLIA